MEHRNCLHCGRSIAAEDAGFCGGCTPYAFPEACERGRGLARIAWARVGGRLQALGAWPRPTPEDMRGLSGAELDALGWAYRSELHVLGLRAELNARQRAREAS